jgi:hypothetical protein
MLSKGRPEGAMLIRIVNQNPSESFRRGHAHLICSKGAMLIKNDGMLMRNVGYNDSLIYTQIGSMLFSPIQIQGGLSCCQVTRVGMW